MKFSFLSEKYRAVMLCTFFIMTVHFFAAFTAAAKEPVRFQFSHRGMEREYYLYLPDNLEKGAPLVFILHGYGGRAMNGGKAMCEVADTNGFAVCFPQGAADFKGKTCWNVGYPFQEGLKTDDVDFLCKLARHLQKQYGLSRLNTFCTGMSNGGEMCYLLAYLKPDVFAAVAPVSGLTLEWMYRGLKARRPVPLMEIHGTEDKTSKWNGDPDNEDGWGEYIAVPAAAGYWAAEARCTHEITEVLPVREGGNKVILHRYVGGNPAWKNSPAVEVRLYEVVGGKHSWAEKDMDTCPEIWKFFSKYLR